MFSPQVSNTAPQYIHEYDRVFLQHFQRAMKRLSKISKRQVRRISTKPAQLLEPVG